MKTILSIFLSAFCWWIQFPDKQGSTEICLSPRAIEQRQKWDIPIDSLDYAVSPAYLDSLRAAGLTIMHTSRWMNGATVTVNIIMRCLLRKKSRFYNFEVILNLFSMADSLVCMTDLPATGSSILSDKQHVQPSRSMLQKCATF